MATSQVNGSATTNNSTKNDGGAVINGGTSDNCTNLSSSNSIKHTGAIDNNHADKILVSGDFNTINVAPLSAKITQLLNNNRIINFAIYFANKDPKIRSMHVTNFIRNNLISNAFRNNRYNFFTGKFDIGYPLNSQNFLGSDQSYNKQFTINIGNPIPSSL
jgi:hypothetical protein